MDVGPRVQLLLEGEHAQLAVLSAQVQRSLEGLSQAPGIDSVAVKAAWDIFYEALQSHMRNEREIVLPLAVEVAEGRAPRRKEELRTWLVRLEGEHDVLRRLALALRAAASRDVGLRREIQPVLELFELHTRAEEIEIYPNVTSTPAPAMRRKTSDEILLSLRRARPDYVTGDEEEEEDEPETLLSRIGRWFGRS